jgi:peptidoglycan/LPS O-acetylase OafA/YrhL
MKSEFRVNNFDLLRIMAASQVVLIHSLTHLGIAHPPGWSIVDAFPGVPIFFAISGFLISAAYERSADLVGYARNRVLRIVPGLWCVVLLTIPVALIFGVHFFRPQALVWLVAQMGGLIYTPGFMSGFGFGSYNGALWTIPIELQFYFLLPAMYFVTARTPKRRTAIFAAVAAAFTAIAFVYAMKSAPLAENTVESASHKLLRYSFIPHFYLFLAGVLLQRVRAHEMRAIAGKGAYWLAGYLALYFALPKNTAGQYVVTTLVLGVTMISAAYTVPGIARRVLRGNDISYGVYIYHGLVLNVFVELGYVHHLWWVPLVAAITVAIASLSWRFVEQPALRRKRGSGSASASSTRHPSRSQRTGRWWPVAATNTLRGSAHRR